MDKVKINLLLEFGKSFPRNGVHNRDARWATAQTIKRIRRKY